MRERMKPFLCIRARGASWATCATPGRGRPLAVILKPLLIPRQLISISPLMHMAACLLVALAKFAASDVLLMLGAGKLGMMCRQFDS